MSCDNSWIYETRACLISSLHLTEPRCKTTDVVRVVLVWMLSWESKALWFSPLSPCSMLNWSRKQFIWKKYLPTICFKQTLAARSPISIGMQLSQVTKGRETKIENWSLCGHADGKSGFLAVILNNSFFSPLALLPIHIYISSPVFSIFCCTGTKTSTISLSFPSFLINILLSNKALALFSPL